MKTYIAYYRVSSRKQGRSGLGLEAQKADVARYVASAGGKIIGEYVEVESGKRVTNRPQLQAALGHARGKKATLIIAKLDRLARNVAFTAALMESGAEFVACDNPTATKLTIHILAAVAEDEARAISDRTVKALAAAKRRGVKLGTHRRGHVIDFRKGARLGLPKAVEAASAKRSAAAADAYNFLMGDVRAWREEGLSLGAIADRLNEAGHRTTAGGEFHPTMIHRLLGR
jgi:DNA invertase Pin-like site-specific DNA recombinase